ncbi:hypothetical protein Tco_1092020 [Tanacetum coccineum]|uniref:Uncharacterized protein n=1 Tax=Tanacetum coccineum TaxID=301880 RepID=A0ABQ5IB16_9ASTR
MQSISLKQRLARKKSSKKQWVHKESVSKQGRKFAKGESSVQRDPLFDEIPEDTVDHMETENAQDVGRTREIVDEDKEIDENILSTKDVLSTDKEKVSTDKENSTDEQIESTDEQRKGTEDHTEEGSATQATQTPTSTIFGDDETIAKVLLNMSQAKAVSREKEKGVELKDIEETDRPRLLLQWRMKSKSEYRRFPKAEKKFKQLESDEEMARKIQEEWEGEEERNRLAEEKATNEALIRNFDDIKARIEADRLLAEKLQEQEREQFTIEERAKFLYDTIVAQRKFLAQQRSEAIRNRPPTKNQLRKSIDDLLEDMSDKDFISIGSAEDERLIKRMNEKGIDSSKSKVIKESKEEVHEESKEEESKRKRKLGTRKKMKKYPIKEWKTECLGTKPQADKAEHLEEIKLKDWNIVSWKLHSSSGVHTLVTEAGLVIHMLVEKKYPLRKKVLVQMLELKLESEEDSTMALELIRFIKKLLAELEPEDFDGNEEDL